jgi:hypothetical protein
LPPAENEPFKSPETVPDMLDTVAKPAFTLDGRITLLLVNCTTSSPDCKDIHREEPLEPVPTKVAVSVGASWAAAGIAGNTAAAIENTSANAATRRTTLAFMATPFIEILCACLVARLFKMISWENLARRYYFGAKYTLSKKVGVNIFLAPSWIFVLL